METKENVMLRLLYLWLLRLHPRAFRNRFAEEMLCIFDQILASQLGEERRAASRLLADGALSLVRQWTRMPGRHEEANALATDAATSVSSPVFCSLPSFKPRPGAMIYGAALSGAAFCVVFLAMRYSWTHRVAFVLPVESYASGSSTSSPEDFKLPSVLASNDAAEAQPRNRFNAGNTKPPSKPENFASAPASEGGINPASAPAGLAQPVHTKTAPREIALARQVGQYTPDISSAAGHRTNHSTSASGVEAVPQPTSAEWIQPYVGTYVTDTRAHLQVTVSTREGQLEIEIDGQGKIAAVAASQTQFFLVGKTDAWIEFVKDQDGTVRELDLYRGGERQTAHRRPRRFRADAQTPDLPR
jgi:hypothetical protein